MPNNCPVCHSSFKDATVTGVWVKGTYEGDALYYIDEANCGQAFPRAFGCKRLDKLSKEHVARYNHPSNPKRNGSVNV